MTGTASPSPSPSPSLSSRSRVIWGSYTITLALIVAGLYVEMLRATEGIVIRSASLFGPHALVWFLIPYAILVAVAATLLLWLRPWTRTLALATLGAVAVMHGVLVAVRPQTAGLVELGVYAALCYGAGRYLFSPDYLEMLEAPTGGQTPNLRRLYVAVTVVGLFSLAGLVAVAIEPLLQRFDMALGLGGG